MRACSVASVVSDSHVTPWTVACQALLSMELSWQEYWSGLSFPPPGDLPDPASKPESPVAPALAGGFFITEPPGKPVPITCTKNLMNQKQVHAGSDGSLGKGWCARPYVLCSCSSTLPPGGVSKLTSVVVWLLSGVRLFATPSAVACQASLSMGFSRQEYWSGLPFFLLISCTGKRIL